MPQSLEAERSVLGAMLLDASAVPAVMAVLAAEDFYLPRHEVAYRAVLESHAGTGATDPIAVAEVLRRHGRNEIDVHGLLDLVEDPFLAVPGTAARHAEIVREKAAQRSILETCLDIARRAYDNELDAADLCERMRAGADDATRGTAGAKTMLDIVREMRAEGPRVHLPTGFQTLDAMTAGGFVVGDVNTLNGPPSLCKTLLALVMAERASLDGVCVAIHCCDERDHDIATRLFQRAGFRRAQIERRDPEDLARMERAAAESSMMFLDDEYTVEQAFDVLVREAEHRRRPACLVIDSLQTVVSSSESRTASEHERLSAKLRTIRKLARRHQVLVLMTSEVGRAVYAAKVPTAGVTDLATGKGSGSIEYYSRFVAVVTSVKGEPDVIELRVAKNKLGVGAIHVEGESGIFLRVERDEQNVAEVPGYVRGAKAEQDPDEKQHATLLAIVARLRESGGEPSSNAVHRIIKGNRADFLDAWKVGKRRGWIVNDGTAREPHYVAGPSAPPGAVPSVCVARPPHPHGSWNREPADAGPVPSLVVSDPGTRRNQFGTGEPTMDDGMAEQPGGYRRKAAR